MFLRGLKITAGNDQERADSSKHKLFDITKTELPEPKGGDWPNDPFRVSFEDINE
jgi:hypothetical protein